MKNLILTIILIATFSLIGCTNSNNNSHNSTNKNNVESVINEKMTNYTDSPIMNNDGAINSNNSTDDNEDDNENNKKLNKIDVDLTKLSATMVYSEVFNMMSVPNDYIDKTIKMNGSFATYQDTKTNKIYYACVVQDATACCQQGIEFVLDKNEDYPSELGENITVIGTFKVYSENDSKYCHLINAKIIDN